MRRGLKPDQCTLFCHRRSPAARAAPYEKGTETRPGAILILRRLRAARAAPYEKGTETGLRAGAADSHPPAARAAPYEKGTETLSARSLPTSAGSRARGPL